jgi:hypothetical protein
MDSLMNETIIEFFEEYKSASEYSKRIEAMYKK